MTDLAGRTFATLPFARTTCEVPVQPGETPWQRGTMNLLCALVTAVEAEGVPPGRAYTLVQAWCQELRTLPADAYTQLWQRMEDV